MSSRSRLMRANFSSGWTNRTLMKSAASRRPSRFGRKTQREIHVRQWARRLKFSTTCDCCSRGLGNTYAASADAKSKGFARVGSRSKSWRNSTEGTRFYVLFPADAGLSETRSTQRRRAENPEPTGDRKKAKAKAKRTAARRLRQMITAHMMSLMQRGFTRLYAEGQVIDLSSPDDYTLDTFDECFRLVDRLAALADIRQRLVDSLEICFQEGHGNANIETSRRRSRHV